MLKQRYWSIEINELSNYWFNVIKQLGIKKIQFEGLTKPLLSFWHLLCYVLKHLLHLWLKLKQKKLKVGLSKKQLSDPVTAKQLITYMDVFGRNQNIRESQLNPKLLNFIKGGETPTVVPRTKGIYPDWRNNYQR